MTAYDFSYFGSNIGLRSTAKRLKLHLKNIRY